MPSGDPLSIALTVAQSFGVSIINDAELIRKININEQSEALVQMHRDVREQRTST